MPDADDEEEKKPSVAAYEFILGKVLKMWQLWTNGVLIQYIYITETEITTTNKNIMEITKESINNNTHVKNINRIMIKMTVWVLWWVNNKWHIWAQQ